MKSYPTYKDSGQPWLGSIPEHWETRRLKYLVTVYLSNVDKLTVEGQTPVSLCNYTDVYYNDQIDRSINFMPVSAPIEQIRKFQLQVGDVLMTKDSETAIDIASPAVVVEELRNVLCGYHLALLRPQKMVFGGYLRYVLASPPFRDHFRMSANGVTRVGLSNDDITTALAIFPPTNEQSAIVAYLDRKTNDIERFIMKKRELIALLNEQKAAVINRAVTKGINRGVVMKASGVDWLGEIPVHWEVRRNGSCFLHRVESGEETLPILSVSIKLGVTLADDDEDDPQRRIEDKTKYKKVRKGDIAYNMMRMWQGAVGVVPTDGLVSPAYVVIKPFPWVNTKYFSYLYRTDVYKSEVNRQSRGIVSDRNRLYWEDFKQMPIPLPPRAEQQSIVEAVDRKCGNIDAVIARTEREIELINEYRTTLISDAMTGKIDVRSTAGAVDILTS